MPDPHLVKLAKLPRQKLEALALRTQKALELVRGREIKAIADSIRERAQELGIEIAEIVGHLSAVPARPGRKPASERVASAPKERSSAMKGKKIKPWFADSAGNTWTGRGQPARFVREHIRGGGKLADLLVDSSKADEAKRIEAKIKSMLGGRAVAPQRRGKRGKKAKGA